MSAMSAKLSLTLPFLVVIATVLVAAESGPDGAETVENLPGSVAGERTRRVIVEEIDKSGRSEMKALELPDDAEDAKEDEERRSEQRREFEMEAKAEGCEDEDGRERRKCLAMRLRENFKSWRESVRRFGEVVDAEIKNLSAELNGDM